MTATAGAAAATLFVPAAAEFAALPPWAHGEPEWVRLGLLRADALRGARLRTIERHGIHAWVSLVRGAIREPDATAALLPGVVAARTDTADRRLPAVELLGAAFLQEKRNLSDLPLFLSYLAGAGADDPEDLYDLTGLWGRPEDRVSALLGVCAEGDATVADTALRLLAAAGMRGFVRDRLPALRRALARHGHGDRLGSLHVRLLQLG